VQDGVRACAHKIELKDMITPRCRKPSLRTEDSVPLIDDSPPREERPRASGRTAEEAPLPPLPRKRSFDEIEFRSFFQKYLDPGFTQPARWGYRASMFENFLSKPGI